MSAWALLLKRALTQSCSYWWLTMTISIFRLGSIELQSLIAIQSGDVCRFDVTNPSPLPIPGFQPLLTSLSALWAGERRWVLLPVGSPTSSSETVTTLSVVVPNQYLKVGAATDGAQRTFPRDCRLPLSCRRREALNPRVGSGWLSRTIINLVRYPEPHMSSRLPNMACGFIRMLCSPWAFARRNSLWSFLSHISIPPG